MKSIARKLVVAIEIVDCETKLGAEEKGNDDRISIVVASVYTIAEFRIYLSHYEQPEDV
jgi:hypothetical protein